jgi:hypothetical protein
VSGTLDVLSVIGGIVAAARVRASSLAKQGAQPEEYAEAQRQVTQAIALEKRVRSLMDATKGVLSWAKHSAPEDAYIEVSPEAIACLRSAYGRAK